MDLQTRKLEFIKEFLKVQSEDVVTRLEKILKKENTSDSGELEPMTKKELNKRIDKSESNFKNNQYKSSSELLAKYE